jgi:ATP-dependent DNA helicase RecQ
LHQRAWGHDFRPDYLRLAAYRAAIGSPTVLALTATASPPVRSEIAERLAMTEPVVILRGFDRPALHLAVRMCEDEDRKVETLVDAVLGWEGARACL